MTIFTNSCLCIHNCLFSLSLNHFLLSAFIVPDVSAGVCYHFILFIFKMLTTICFIVSIFSELGTCIFCTLPFVFFKISCQIPLLLFLFKPFFHRFQFGDFPVEIRYVLRVLDRAEFFILGNRLFIRFFLADFSQAFQNGIFV